MQVTASNLIGLNDDNEVVEGSGEPELSAATIHRGVHQSRPDARAVFHLHMPYSTALGEYLHVCVCVCLLVCFLLLFCCRGCCSSSSSSFSSSFSTFLFFRVVVLHVYDLCFSYVFIFRLIQC